MNIGLGIGIPFTRSSLWASIFTPSALFLDGSTQGVWYDPSDINLTWRRNLLTETEFRNGLVDAPARGGLISATTLIGYQAAIAFSRDGVTSSYAYKSIYIAPLTTYSISAVVEMSDGLPPTFGSGTVASSTNDFIFVIGGETFSPITYVVQSIENALYRVSATFTTPSNPSAASAGIVKYNSNSNRTFKTTAYQLELGSTATPYQRITDGVQDYLQYQPLPVMYRDAAGTQPVTAVEQPVGLMLDKSKGLVLGPELVTNGDFSQGNAGWSYSGTGIDASSGALVFTAALSNIATNAATTYTSGKTYKVQFTITSYTAGAVQMQLSNGGTAPAVNSGNFNAVGTYTVYLQSNGNTTLRILTVGTTTLSIDNISVRELPGNHAFNSSGNSANFPVLSARYNLLTKTEQFDDAVWTKLNSSITANAVAAPDGTLTADKITETAVSGPHIIYQGVTFISATVYTISMNVKSAERTKLRLYNNMVGGFDASFDLVAGTATNVVGTGAITPLVNGWYRCSVTFTSGTSGASNCQVQILDTFGNSSYTGDGTSGIYIWGADLRVANDGINLPSYQRVNTATDYDTVGFKPYVRFNGVNQWLQTNSIDFSYSDKMFVCAGVRKLSDGIQAILTELSENGNTYSGTFWVTAPNNISTNGNYTSLSRGSASTSISQEANSAITLAPVTNVVSATHDILGDLSRIRLNGAYSGTNGTADKGAGNFGNYPLYIGARAGSSLWFNGRLYQLVIAAGSEIRLAEEDSDLFLSESGDFITAETTVAVIQSAIEQTEAFVNRKTKAF